MQVIDHILIPIETCELTFAQMAKEIERLQALYPDDEIFLDGDEFAIIRREVIA